LWSDFLGVIPSDDFYVAMDDGFIVPITQSSLVVCAFDVAFKVTFWVKRGSDVLFLRQINQDTPMDPRGRLIAIEKIASF